MNVKNTILLLLVLSLAVPPADAVLYKKHNAILRKAVGLHRALPSSRIRWKVLGKSGRKRRIYYKEFGKGEKLTMIIGGIHGDEPAGVITAIKLAQHIKKTPSSIKNRVIIIPCLNPDGLMKGRRTNGRKVDINRNFPTESWSPDYIKYYNNSGKLPASEPETVLIANAIEDYKPDMIIQLHQPFNTLYPDSRTPLELVKRMSEITGIPISNDIGYETPGSLGNYKTSVSDTIYGITYELCPIDREPDYKIIIKSLIEAINY